METAEKEAPTMTRPGMLSELLKLSAQGGHRARRALPSLSTSPSLAAGAPAPPKSKFDGYGFVITSCVLVVCVVGVALVMKQVWEQRANLNLIQEDPTLLNYEIEEDDYSPNQPAHHRDQYFTPLSKLQSS